jgi:hypothetical protein
MAIELLSKDTLINAALMTNRPVAFLVGSPLSQKNGVGVPDVSGMLGFARDEVQRRGAFALGQYDAVVSGKVGADAYQAAMKWLGQNPGQDAVDEVIKRAVLQARKAEAGQLATGKDGEADEWGIPVGTIEFAELIARGDERFIGPVLTTNFDPLISLALRKSGRHSGRRVLVDDGSLGGAAEDEPGTCNVVHLHGFWRDSLTLHTQAQLTNPRPRLKASLQRLLVAQPRTLIVAAYGGWDDVFTEALVELVNDEFANLDVIWCFYESDPAIVELRYSKLLGAMRPAIVKNRFRPFGGIDCHSIFGEILSTLDASSAPAAVASFASSPIAGWQQIDGPFLDSLEALSSEELIRYFDGAVPSWRHAVSPGIPRREGVESLALRLAQIAHDGVARSMHLIRAAGGEGKSTVLLQVAADISRASEWSVLWRRSPSEGISPDLIDALDPTKRWLLVADDADGIVSCLATTAEYISQTGRIGVHFLLATRDADWNAARGPKNPWSTWFDTFPDVLLRGITPEDANAILVAWESAGSDGLRELAAIPDQAGQVAAFEAAVWDAADQQTQQAKRRRPQEGSFFGGLLAVRFGQNGLQAHVRVFLQRLEHIHIQHGNRSLFDALLYVAACHGAGIPGIDERVLADLVGVPREWVQRYVVRPLGEEAAAVHSAGYALTRHSRVAAAILVEAEQTFGIDLAEIWAQIVKQTVKTGGLIQMDRLWFSTIVHAAPRLQQALPPHLPEERRKSIAIAAAQASVEAESHRLSQLVDLAKTYRITKDVCRAVRVFRDSVASASSMVDYDEMIRGFWYEWGVCEGIAAGSSTARGADAWLQGLSLSDHLISAPITEEQGKLSCAGLGVAFGKLAQSLPGCPFAKARRSVALLGRLTNPDPKTAGYFDRHDREADKLNTPYPRDFDEAIDWLCEGVSQAGRELNDFFLEELVDPDQVSFGGLRSFFGSRNLPQRRAKHRPPMLRERSAPDDDTKPIQLPNVLAGKVQAGIERVLEEAWKVVPQDAVGEDRLKLARKQAIQSISRLSPYIRKQVGAYFNARNWEPLRSCDPEAES